MRQYIIPYIIIDEIKKGLDESELYYELIREENLHYLGIVKIDCTPERFRELMPENFRGELVYVRKDEEYQLISKKIMRAMSCFAVIKSEVDE